MPSESIRNSYTVDHTHDTVNPKHIDIDGGTGQYVQLHIQIIHT